MGIVTKQPSAEQRQSQRISVWRGGAKRSVCRQTDGKGRPGLLVIYLLIINNIVRKVLLDVTYLGSLEKSLSALFGL